MTHTIHKAPFINRIIHFFSPIQAYINLVVKFWIEIVETKLFDFKLKEFLEHFKNFYLLRFVTCWRRKLFFVAENRTEKKIDSIFIKTF